MSTILLTVHLIFAVLLVGVILIQKGGGDALSGLGASSGGGGGMMSARGAKTFLTRATAILFTLFLSTSIILAYGAKQGPAASSAVDDLLNDLPAPSAAPVATGDIKKTSETSEASPSQQEMESLIKDVVEEPAEQPAEPATNNNTPATPVTQ